MNAVLRQTCAPRLLLLALLVIGLGLDAAVSHGQSVASGAVTAMADESAPAAPYDHRHHGEEASKRRARYILELQVRDAGDDVHSVAADTTPLLAGRPGPLDPDLPLVPASPPDRDAGLSGQPRLRLKLQLGQAP